MAAMAMAGYGGGYGAMHSTGARKATLPWHTAQSGYAEPGVPARQVQAHAAAAGAGQPAQSRTRTRTRSPAHALLREASVEEELAALLLDGPGTGAQLDGFAQLDGGALGQPPAEQGLLAAGLQLRPMPPEYALTQQEAAAMLSGSGSSMLSESVLSQTSPGQEEEPGPAQQALRLQAFVHELEGCFDLEVDKL